MAFQFMIQIMDISDPPVWRKFLVPEHFTFMRFHSMIQEGFGWTNSHLFQFTPGGFGSQPVIGMVFDDDYDEEIKTTDAAQVQISDIFNHAGQEYVYTYDFGDDWTHQIILEKITPDKILRAQCPGGGGSCPPEDCGGASGYQNFKLIMSDSKHHDHREFRRWLGLKRNKKWDADKFDLAKSNKLVTEV